METKKTLANSRRKLGEFNHWRSVAGLYPLYFVDCKPDYRLELFELPDRSGPEWQHRHEFIRIAPEETNEILRAVNSIEDERQRVILIMSYICPFAERDSFSSKFGDPEIMERVGVKKSQFYRLKQAALLAFAKSYRQGVLETYTEQQ